MHESFEIPIDHPRARTSDVRARFDLPDQDPGGPVVLLAHGAGAAHDSAFMQSIALGLAGAGLPTLRFDYAYATRMVREGKRRAPDRRDVLEHVHHAALDLLRKRYPSRPIVLAGKSMGGRIASYLATEDEGSALTFFGYPTAPRWQAGTAAQRALRSHRPTGLVPDRNARRPKSLGALEDGPRDLRRPDHTARH